MTDVQRFELPRDDWYDSEGRLYKDVIIENLNAIESKLLELQGLDPIEVDLPDFETLVYPDVTLASDSNCIINLRSFLNIMNLINYPLECQTSGKTVKRLVYWNSNYRQVVINNLTISDAGEDKPFIVLDADNESVSASASFTPSSNNILIGKYINGRIISIFEKFPMNVNLLQMLSSMVISTKQDTNTHTTREVYVKPNRVAGYIGGESGFTGTGIFQDKGGK